MSNVSQNSYFDHRICWLNFALIRGLRSICDITNILLDTHFLDLPYMLTLQVFSSLKMALGGVNAVQLAIKNSRVRIDTKKARAVA